AVSVPPAWLRTPPPPRKASAPATPVPPTALFCANEVLLTVADEPLRMARPPPCPGPALPPAPPLPPAAAFEDTVLLVIVRVELSVSPKRTLNPSEMPPPYAGPPSPPAAPLAPTAWLLLTVQLVTVMAPENELSRPPPVAKASGEPAFPEPARATLPVNVQ